MMNSKQYLEYQDQPINFIGTMNQDETQEEDNSTEMQERNTQKGGSKLFGMISDRDRKEADLVAQNYPMPKQRVNKQSR